MDGLSKRDFDDLKITEIGWVKGTHFGPEHDYCHAFTMKNNLDEYYHDNTSPAYGSKTVNNDSFSFGD